MSSHGTCSGVNAPTPCLTLEEKECCESIVPESVKGVHGMPSGAHYNLAQKSGTSFGSLHY